ncbi:Protein TIC 214 [Frankliniella fusca]|uniref:Protein TIC 214 n=1 Tax=Frankliniella fusca TaxID=407009 RepID=A0AAE1H8N9_9NEOP|nr:Protein TIC 214 [Frankliniella fusca]
MENSCFTLEIAGDEDEDADELRDTDRQGSENESDGALDGGNDAEQEEVERNLNLSQERNEENNGANDENGFNLNHSNLDSEVNAREGTKVKDLFVLALALSVRHNWNYEELIHHLQSPNSILEIPCLPQSVKDDLYNRVKCRNKQCKTITVRSKLKYFVTLDLKSQLQRFLAIPGMADILNNKNNRDKRNVDSLQDIFDGSEYKRLISGGIISEHDFTYIFNTDGVQYLKGAKGSAWPLYIRLNELPPSLRQKYLFLAGVWVDSSEPVMNTFLEPFVNQANNLSSEARYTLYNMSQFNSKNGGCTFCNIKGVQSGGTKYPVLPPCDDPEPVLRTTEMLEDQMIEAQQTGTVIEGVKGVSALMKLSHFSLMGGQGLDDLHACYEGCAKQHTNLLMRVKGQTNMKQTVEIVNSRLSNIRFPSKISRNVFDAKKRKSWKGSMWRTWLLFIGPVCLGRSYSPEVH